MENGFYWTSDIDGHFLEVRQLINDIWFECGTDISCEQDEFAVKSERLETPA